MACASAVNSHIARAVRAARHVRPRPLFELLQQHPDPEGIRVTRTIWSKWEPNESCYWTITRTSRTGVCTGRVWGKAVFRGNAVEHELPHGKRITGTRKREWKIWEPLVESVESA